MIPQALIERLALKALESARHKAVKPDCITHAEIAQELEEIISQIGVRPTWVTAEMLRAVIRRLG